MPTLGVTKEHWIQSFTSVGALMISCGLMLVGATYFIVGHIDAVEAADNAALSQQAQNFNKLLADLQNVIQTEIRNNQDLEQKNNNQLDHRVTIIEDKDDAFRNTLDSVNTRISQLQATSSDLTTALAKFSAIEDVRNGTGKRNR